MKHLGPWVSVSILGARHFDWASIPENFCVELPRAGDGQACAGSVEPARPDAVGRDLALLGD